jgi:cell fate regulator YaaT (PSP1 superfamily)
MSQAGELRLVGLRFSKVGKLYHFDASGIDDLKLGDRVVVETSRGWQLGEAAQWVTEGQFVGDGPWKAIDRKATPRDLLLRQDWARKEEQVVELARQKTRELRLGGVKIVVAEFSFDGSRLAIMFSNDTEEKIDTKNLRKAMQKFYPTSQVELRQIGPRDVAKVLEGIGACGLEKRCCSMFLTDFTSISIKMAKEQGISLTPSEITGMCGRLRCCLNYEYELYSKLRKQMPKRNKRVLTPSGEGKVVDVLTLREMVIVDIPEQGRKTFNKDEIQRLDERGRPIENVKNRPEDNEDDSDETSE